jgi:tRNA(His) 5'-end guanylyltransferase
MKKLSSLTAICAGLLLASFTSCASYQNEAAIMSLGSNLNTYVEADIDYSSAKKVEATVNTATVLGFIQLERNGNKTLRSANRYKGLTKRQSQALYRAKENSGVDIILEPEFETEKHSWFFGAYSTSKTKVKGWGVNVKGIKEDKHQSSIPNR